MLKIEERGETAVIITPILQKKDAVQVEELRALEVAIAIAMFLKEYEEENFT